jgi:hypothetical protein
MARPPEVFVRPVTAAEGRRLQRIGLTAKDQRWPKRWRSPEPGQQVAYYVARDADEKPLVFARVALFGEFAVLFIMLSRLDGHPSTSWARYQLHTFLTHDLGCAWVKHLLVGSALREPAGHQYSQHLLGYRVRNLRLKLIESDAT